MSETSTVERGDQLGLLNLDSKEISPYWVDPLQPLKIPKNPLHHKAHELQILLEILKKQAKNNPAQFNSKNYIDTLNAFSTCVTAINKGETSESLGSGNLGGSDTEQGGAPVLGGAVPPSMGAGVPTKNPFAG